MRDRLLDYYKQELLFVRELGKEFAEKHKDVATRLKLNGATGKSGDPHVDLLMDAFAFLAGRIQMKIDDEFPEITESFLNVLYPHYLAPIPSMSIVQFVLDPDRGRLTSGYKVKSETLLYSPKIPGATFRCQYRTCYPITLWPLEVTAVSLEGDGPVGQNGRWPRAVLKIGLHFLNDTVPGKLKAGREEAAEPLDSLRFYINHTDYGTACQIYELLFGQIERGAGGIEKVEARSIIPEKNAVGGSSGRISKPAIIPLRLRAVGFEDDEALLPYTSHSFSGYRLLSEYFAFPQKFLFFEISGLKQASQAELGSQCEILIYLENARPIRSINQNTFLLGCTPIINLFEKEGAPIDLTHRRSEYRIAPNKAHESELAFEVYSVDAVETIDVSRQRVRQYQPFYSLRHSWDDGVGERFWFSMRRPAASLRRQAARKEREAMDHGTEVYLSLVEPDLNLDEAPGEVIRLRLMCLNRDLPSALQFREGEGDFQLEGTAPVSRVRRLVDPTPTRRLPLDRNTQWRLISHLSLNHLSLVSDGEGDSPEALQEILKLYDYVGADIRGKAEDLNTTETTNRQILGIKRVSSNRIAHQTGVRLKGSKGSVLGKGIVQGLEIIVEFDESHYPGNSPLLFASALERFFGMYVSVNSFIRLVATTRQGTFKEWPPRLGDQVLL